MARTPRGLLHRTRLSEEIWRRAVGLMVESPSCSAMELMRELKFGSYRTAWRTARIVRRGMGTVRWPLLGGDIEMGELDLRSRKQTRSQLWIAQVATSNRKGLLRAWVSRGDFIASARSVTDYLSPNATLITPPGPYVLALKGRARLRVRPLGEKEAFDGICATIEDFRRHLLKRNHRGIEPALAERYVEEFVFHRNAKVLGWGQEKRAAAVWERLLKGAGERS